MTTKDPKCPDISEVEEAVIIPDNIETAAVREDVEANWQSVESLSLPGDKHAALKTEATESDGLKDQGIRQLRIIAKALKIKGYSRMKKEALYNSICEKDSEAESKIYAPAENSQVPSPKKAARKPKEEDSKPTPTEQVEDPKNRSNWRFFLDNAVTLEKEIVAEIQEQFEAFQSALVEQGKATQKVQHLFLRMISKGVHHTLFDYDFDEKTKIKRLAELFGLIPGKGVLSGYDLEIIERLDYTLAIQSGGINISKAKILLRYDERLREADLLWNDTTTENILQGIDVRILEPTTALQMEMKIRSLLYNEPIEAKPNTITPKDISKSVEKKIESITSFIDRQSEINILVTGIKGAQDSLDRLENKCAELKAVLENLKAGQKDAVRKAPKRKPRHKVSR